MSDPFDVSVYLMACARDCLDEPPLFGPRRMVEATARLVSDTGDPVLARLREQIEQRRAALLGMDRDAFAVWLDELVAGLAGEALQRELRGGDADVVERFWAAYNAHDVEAVAGLYAADATHHEVAQGRRVTGAAEITGGLRRFLESFPDAHWEPHRRIAGGGAVAVPYRLTGTLAAPLGPFRAAGQKLDLEGVFVIETDGSAIVATADYWDAATFGRQMEAA